MTFRKWAEQFCYENGMFEQDAKVVVQQLVDNPAYISMRTRWDEDVTAYPPSMKNVLVLPLKSQALAWIEQNCPEAWYKPMFQ